MFGFNLQIWLVVLVLSVAAAFYSGMKVEQNSWEAKMAAANAEIERLKNTPPIITEKIVVEYKDRIKYITRIEKVNVPFYVPKESDEKCVVNSGAVTVINSAADNTDPPPPDSKVTEDSGKRLSELTETVKQNYTTYNAVRQQLHSLQKWVTEQQKNWNSK